jgi:hypothetical protein
LIAPSCPILSEQFGLHYLIYSRNIRRKHLT